MSKPRFRMFDWMGNWFIRDKKEDRVVAMVTRKEDAVSIVKALNPPKNKMKRKARRSTPH